jgi:hypothetical protein
MRGFELALDDALKQVRAEYPEELERAQNLGIKEIKFYADLSVRNPADIDEYFADIQWT